MSQQLCLSMQVKHKVCVKSNCLSKVPLKHFFPCPSQCILDKYNSGDEEIIIVSHHNDGKIVCYNPNTKQYRKLCDYPKSKFKFHSIRINTKTKQLYIYDGVQPVFMILSICKNGKKQSTDLRVSSKKLIKQHNVIKTGQSFSSLYIEYPYNEFHIIGGTLSNKHYKWNNVAQIFELYSIFNHKDKLLNVQFLFIKTKNMFIMFGGNLDQSMYSLNCNNNNNNNNNNNHPMWNEINSKIPFYQFSEYGCILYQDEYIITFGGNKTWSTRNKGSSFTNWNDQRQLIPQKWGLMDDIFICSINNKFKWYELMIKCPNQGKYHAIYLKYTDKIHLFNKQNYKHWQIDPKSIIKDNTKTNENVCNDFKKEEKSKEEEEKKIITSTNNKSDDDDDDDLYDAAPSTKGFVQDADNNNNNNNNLQIQLENIIKTMNEMRTDIAVLKQKIFVLERNNNNDDDMNDNDNNKLRVWLNELKLSEYYPILIEQGFGDNISLLSTLTNEDMISLGINKMAHRKLLLSQIRNDFTANGTNSTTNNNIEGF